jgi:acid phosphatase (class A)
MVGLPVARPSRNSTAARVELDSYAARNPAHADAILARGRAFGQSRVACNVHWLSDIEEGRLMASATVARLHDEAAFKADLAAAGGEIASARARGLDPTRDCAKEAAQLAGG